MNRKHLFALSIVLIALLMAASSAFAQTTPAGTQIRNRASATYQDLSGNSYTSLSNEVITIVLPVTSAAPAGPPVKAKGKLNGETTSQTP